MSKGNPVVVIYRNRSQQVFPSVTSAAVALNLSTSTIRTRLKNWLPIQDRDDIRKIEYAEVQE